MTPIYLDYNATTPVAPEVREAMLPFLGETYGNPSSLHRLGAEARKALDDARAEVAGQLHCDDREIVFTSGGSEAINLAIKGAITASSRRPAHLITTAVEHQAVLQSIDQLERGGLATVTRLPVNHEGEIDLNRLQAAIRDETVLISVMFANNETGNIYPIARVGEIARACVILFHTDAVQAVGKLPIDLSRLPVDLLAASAHKFYGPKGVGFLYIRRGTRLARLIDGGSQELEKRGGTENLPGIIGMATALRIANRDLEKEGRRLASLRDRLQAGCLELIPEARIHGSPQGRLANTLNLTFEGVTSEAILIALDRVGIAVSSGSACASGAVRPSHVLVAMGVREQEAKGAVRFSLGRGTTDSEIDYVLEKLPTIVKTLQG